MRTIYLEIKAMYNGNQSDVDHFEWATSYGTIVISESGKRDVAYFHKDNSTAVVYLKACNGAGCTEWVTKKMGAIKKGS